MWDRHAFCKKTNSNATVYSNLNPSLSFDTVVSDKLKLDGNETYKSDSEYGSFW